MSKVTRIVVGTALVASLAVAATLAASAKDGDIRAGGVCTKGSTSKIKLSEEDGRIEVEFEVDQNRNGVRLERSAFPERLSDCPSDARHAWPERLVRAQRVAPNTAGTDSFRARATRASGEVCTGTASAFF